MNIKEAVERKNEISMGLYRLVKDPDNGIIGFRRGHKLHKQLNNLSKGDGLIKAILSHLFTDNENMNKFSYLLETENLRLSKENRDLRNEIEALQFLKG